MFQHFNTRKVLAVVGVASLAACSSVDRLSSSDYGMYSGTRASSEKSTGVVDMFGSALTDTVLLPVTGTAWLFGYRYQDSAVPQSGQSSVAPK